MVVQKRVQSKYVFKTKIYTGHLFPGEKGDCEVSDEPGPGKWVPPLKRDKDP